MSDTKSKLENYVLEKAKKKNGGTLTDERQMQQNSTALATAVVFAILFDIVMMIIHFFRHNTEAAFPYLAQLLVISLGFGIAAIGQKEAGYPTSLYGKKVSPEKSGKGFAKRLLTCVLECAVFAVLISAFNMYNAGKFEVTAEVIRNAVLGLTVISVAVCERRVHRYRKYQAQLDAEENDLDD